MTTYADVKKQIAQLEKKAADLRKVEVAKAVANIREQMAKYELTVEDIAPVKSSAKTKAATRSPKVKVGKPAKYMDPKTGKTWTGHGKAPAWIAVATKKGRRDDFLIEKVSLDKDSKPAEMVASQKPMAAKKTPTATKKVVTKKVAAKKPKVAAKKAPVAKKVSASVKKAPAVTKGKAATQAKKVATKAPAKSPAKAKPVSKPSTKPTASAKPVRKTTAKPTSTVTEAMPAAAA
jgi:DNA-binding protein H-NS